MFALLLAVALAAAPPSSMVGTWTLDLTASSDVAPVLEKLGIPGFLGKAAGSSTQKVSVQGERLVVEVDGSLGDRTETVDLSGKQAVTGSFFGYEYRVIPRLDGEAIVAAGTIRIDGKDQLFVSRRSVSGAVMTVDTTIGTGADAVTLRRVFRKVG